MRQPRAILMLAAVAAASSALLVPAAASDSEASATPVVHKLVAQGRTNSARAAGEAHRQDSAHRQDVERDNPPLDQPTSGGSGDPVVQTTTSGTATSAALTFKGLGADDLDFIPKYHPPDTNGAVGRDVYVQVVNAVMAAYAKADGSRIGMPTDISAAFAGLAGGAGDRCATRNDGDPIVQYDKEHARWIVSQIVTTSPYLECVAVSVTDDPLGAYRAFAFDYGSEFPDYPKMGVWPGSYVFTYNMFNNLQSFSGGQTCVLDREAMVTPSVTPGDARCFTTTLGGLLPSDVDGSREPPAGAAAYVVDRSGATLNVWRLAADWTAGTFGWTGPTAVTNVAPFATPCANCVPQPNTRQALSTLSDRVMYRLAYRNWTDLAGAPHESLLLTHAVGTSTSRNSKANGIAFRWYELRPSGAGLTAYQQGTYMPDATNRWITSAAMAANGSIAVGYSAASSSVYPSIRWTSRAAGDPLGTLRAESSIVVGGGSQTGTSRWGDYAAMRVDPVDDCTMWFTSEYLLGTGAFWSTRIAKLTPPGC